MYIFAFMVIPTKTNTFNVNFPYPRFPIRTHTLLMNIVSISYSQFGQALKNTEQVESKDWFLSPMKLNIQIIDIDTNMSLSVWQFAVVNDFSQFWRSRVPVISGLYFNSSWGIASSNTSNHFGLRSCHQCLLSTTQNNTDCHLHRLHKSRGCV